MTRHAHDAFVACVIDGFIRGAHDPVTHERKDVTMNPIYTRLRGFFVGRPHRQSQARYLDEATTIGDAEMRMREIDRDRRRIRMG